TAAGHGSLLLELDSRGRRRASGKIGVEQRQLIILERDPCHFGVEQGKLLGGERGKPRIVRAATQRAGDDENPGSRHERQMSEIRCQRSDVKLYCRTVI